MIATSDTPRCSDCGATNRTVMVGTTLGDMFCARCWRETTRDRGPVPPSPLIDAHIGRVDAIEAEVG